MGKSKIRSDKHQHQSAQQIVNNREVEFSRDSELASLSGRIWTVGCKVRGIGELVKYHSGEPSIDQETVNYGLGAILTDMADELARIWEEIDNS